MVLKPYYVETMLLDFTRFYAFYVLKCTFGVIFPQKRCLKYYIMDWPS